MILNKVLIKLYVPKIEEQYDIWLPLNRRIHNVISLLVKIVKEFSGGYYTPKSMPLLYDRLTAKQFDINMTVKEANIRNGTELILI